MSRRSGGEEGVVKVRSEFDGMIIMLAAAAWWGKVFLLVGCLLAFQAKN